MNLDEIMDQLQERSLIEISILDYQSLLSNRGRRTLNLEFVTMGDVKFITRLFEDKLVLNEEELYRRTIDYKEYDDNDDGWRLMDYRDYIKWKKKKYGTDKFSDKLEKSSIHYKFDPQMVKDPDICWIAFTKYGDDYWSILGRFPPDGKYRVWFCDSRYGLEDFKKMNIF